VSCPKCQYYAEESFGAMCVKTVAGAALILLVLLWDDIVLGKFEPPTRKAYFIKCMEDRDINLPKYYECESKCRHFRHNGCDFINRTRQVGTGMVE